jgi:hypothetical protein
MRATSDWKDRTPEEWDGLLEHMIRKWQVGPSSAKTYMGTVFGILTRKGARLHGITKPIMRGLDRCQVAKWQQDLDKGKHPLDKPAVEVTGLVDEHAGQLEDWMILLMEASKGGTRMTTIGEARRGQFRQTKTGNWKLGTFQDKGDFRPWPATIHIRPQYQPLAKRLWGRKPPSGRWTPENFLDQLRQALPSDQWTARGPRRQAQQQWGKRLSPKETACLAHHKGEHTQRNYQGWITTKWERNRVQRFRKGGKGKTTGLN